MVVWSIAPYLDIKYTTGSILYVRFTHISMDKCKLRYLLLNITAKIKPCQHHLMGCEEFLSFGMKERDTQKQYYSTIDTLDLNIE